MWVALLALLGGCVFEREPGPHPEDEGKFTYWLVLDSEGTTSQCTDAQSWDALISPPQFDPYTYIVYRVEEGGEEAGAGDDGAEEKEAEAEEAKATEEGGEGAGETEKKDDNTKVL